MRPARAVPYELNARGQADFSNRTVSIYFGNSGKAAAVFHVRSGNSHSGPWTYTVGPNAVISDSWAFKANGQTAYDLSVYGPNGFLRSFKGSIFGNNKANLEITSVYDAAHCSITLNIFNQETAACEVNILDAYTKETIVFELKPGQFLTRAWPLKATFGWYDFVVEVNSDSSFQQRLAGHVETGNDSMSDPVISASVETKQE